MTKTFPLKASTAWYRSRWGGLPAYDDVADLCHAYDAQAEYIRDLEKRLAALSLVSEDVARAAESFAKYHDEHAGYGGASWEFHARAATYIRDIATAAARVPGLEVDLKGAQDALASALLREVDLERQRDDLHRENVANERAATTAESERDAARQDAKEYKQLLDECDRQRDAYSERNDVLTARVAELEGEKAAAKANAESTLAEVIRQRDELADVVIPGLGDRLAAAEADLSSLRAGMEPTRLERPDPSTLEDALASLRLWRGGARSANQRALENYRRAEQAEARATAAEQRLAAARAAIVEARDGFLKVKEWALARRMGDLLEHEVNAPTPAASGSVARNVAAELADTEAAFERAWRGPCGAKPTPAPGLREAVGNRVKTELAYLGVPDEDADKVAAKVQTEFAAYDASEPSVTHAQLAAVVGAYALQEEQAALDEDAGDVGEEVQRRVARHEGRAEGAREVLRRVTGGQVPAKAEPMVTMGVGDGTGRLFVHGTYDSIKAAQTLSDKVAKWDAAVGRARAPKLESAARGAFDAALASGEVSRLAMHLAVNAAIRFVLGLTLPTGPGTPPSGPGGGEKCPACKGSGEDWDMDEEGGTRNAHRVPCSTCKGSGTQCARISTHTPTSPLPAQPEFAAPLPRFAVVDADEDTANGKTTGFDDRGSAPEVVQEADGRWLAESRRVNGAMAYGAAPEDATANVRQVEQDAAPDVAWEGDGVRVLADGAWEFMGESIPEWLPGFDQHTSAVARALAEAKREAELKTCGALRDGRQCVRVTLAEPVPGYFVCEQCIAEDAARKAAEAMRERAAKAGGGATFDQRSAVAVRDAIRALPLEDK